jgi:hypothetical protein
MLEWWSGLAALNQAFFLIALFFSLLFLWQLLAAIIGLAGGGADMEVGGADADVGGADMDAGGDVPAGMEADVGGADIDVHGVEGFDTLASFKLLSVRGIIAFGMLFGWSGALYLQGGTATGTALVYALLWALAGMVVVSAVFYLMMRLTETGSPQLATCVGRPGTVYMDIPAGGEGQVRTMVSGALSCVVARAVGGEAMPGGTPVRIRRLIDTSTVEVERLTD